MSESKVRGPEDNDSEGFEPYNWKQLPVVRPQGTAIEKIAESGAITRVWDMLNVIDIFSMSFVAQGLRETVINHAKTTKYMTKRGRQILLTTLNVILGDNDARGFLNIMRDHRLYVGGSSILHGIMYEHPSVNRWNTTDIDAYVKTDADFRMMIPKMGKLFKSFHDRFTDREGNYPDSWFYGYWLTNESKYTRFGTTIDVISANHGIEWYDMTILQNSITWDGRIRCTDPMTIINRELHLAKSFSDVLCKQIWTSSEHGSSIEPLLGSMIDNLVSRVRKYTKRGFSLVTDVVNIFEQFNMKSEFINYVNRCAYFVNGIPIYNDLRGKSGIIDPYYCNDPHCCVLNCTNSGHYIF